MLSKEMANQILSIHFSDADTARYEELSTKAQEGRLTKGEEAELDEFLNVSDVLTVLKTKAEAILRDSAA